MLKPNHIFMCFTTFPVLHVNHWTLMNAAPYASFDDVLIFVFTVHLCYLLLYPNYSACILAKSSHFYAKLLPVWRHSSNPIVIMCSETKTEGRIYKAHNFRVWVSGDYGKLWATTYLVIAEEESVFWWDRKRRLTWCWNNKSGLSMCHTLNLK